MSNDLKEIIEQFNKAIPKGTDKEVVELLEVYYITGLAKGISLLTNDNIENVFDLLPQLEEYLNCRRGDV